MDNLKWVILHALIFIKYSYSRDSEGGLNASNYQLRLMIIEASYMVLNSMKTKGIEHVTYLKGDCTCK